MVSDMVKISSGIIPGSCLGRVLLVLYINSIVEVLPDNLSCLFAITNGQDKLNRLMIAQTSQLSSAKNY